MSNDYLIFTDMDGTLLDHHDYSFTAVSETLVELKKQQIPVIPNTSKTFAELEVLRTEIGLTDPFIVENGSAVYIPLATFPVQPEGTQETRGYWRKEFTIPREHWLELLEELAAEFQGQFTHFAKMSVADIVAATGLSSEDAERAADRGYGEPVLWQGDESDKARFMEALTDAGATPLMGGRFLHVSSFTDKGNALNWLVAEYGKQFPDADFQSIALGDGQNDAAMLNAADYAVRITSPVNPLPELTKTENVITSTLDGPAGWAECIALLINTDL